MTELQELDPRTPEYRAVASVVAAVAQRTGRTSRWTGRLLIDPDPKPTEVGLAHADGTLTLSELKVFEPLRRAYGAREQGTPLGADDLDALRDAAATAVHEGAHLIDRDGDAPDGHPVSDAPAIALDEGLVEQWTHDHLDDVIHDAGLDRDLPELTGHASKDAYPAYTSATRSLLDGLGPLTGRTPDELAAGLMATDRSQRWNHLADLAIAHGLGGDATAEDRAGLADALRQQFSRAQQIQESGQLDADAKKQQGWHVGRSTASLVEFELDRIRGARERERAAVPDPELGRLADLLRDQPAAAFAPGFARTTPDGTGAAAPPPGIDPPSRRPSQAGRGLSRT